MLLPVQYQTQVRPAHSQLAPALTPRPRAVDMAPRAEAAVWRLTHRNFFTHRPPKQARVGALTRARGPAEPAAPGSRGGRDDVQLRPQS